MATDPFEDFQTGFFGHVDVQQDEGRKRAEFTVGEGTGPGEICHGLLPVGHGSKRVSDTGFCEGALEKENISLLVFSVKDGAGGCHRGVMYYWIDGFAFLNSSQKRLP